MQLSEKSKLIMKQVFHPRYWSCAGVCECWEFLLPWNIRDAEKHVFCENLIICGLFASGNPHHADVHLNETLFMKVYSVHSVKSAVSEAVSATQFQQCCSLQHSSSVQTERITNSHIWREGERAHGEYCGENTISFPFSHYITVSWAIEPQSHHNQTP